MLMMDYGSQYATSGGSGVSSSTSTSDTLSGMGIVTTNGATTRQTSRVRTIRLVRPNQTALPPPGLTCRHGPNLGFSLRGGREHGTGFFVSHVELGSEAHRQGLRVGDQIVRVNGFTIEDAVHREVLQLISNHTHLSLKVRSVGMIPVKDKRSDPLSWQIISDCSNSSTRSSPQLGEKNHDVRITINVAPRSKLGCGICKGPDWKPGIFIQFTKEGGIARESGLRPGDQILYCNGVDFGDIAFNEAVNLMKSSRQLDLIVRKSAGSELFPGESSGYNSSASSVTGDQSPSWSDSKRLSIVKEESMDLEDRLSNLDRFAKAKVKKWEKIEWDDDVGSCTITNDVNNATTTDNKNFYKPTIINLSEHSITIKNNNGTAEEILHHHNHRNNQQQQQQQQQEMPVNNCVGEIKTVVVDVHRPPDIDATKIITQQDHLNKIPLSKTSSTSSFASSISRSSNQSSATATSLSSAISQELQRRLEKNKTEEKPSIDEQLQHLKKNVIIKGLDSEKQEQHHRLMDEFRKAHKKMFKSIQDEPEAVDPNRQLEQQKDRMNAINNRDFSQKVSERLSDLSSTTNNKEAPQQRGDEEKSTTFTSTTGGPPPPPPPFPLVEHNHQQRQTPQLQHATVLQPLAVPIVTNAKPKQKAPPPPVPVKTSTLSYNQPPPCPTPDYDTLSLNSSNSTLPRNAGLKKCVNRTASHNPLHNGDSVEMESLDSFRIHNPNTGSPKPPQTYFQLQANRAQTTRPVSVTIGEYSSSVNGNNRKQVGKFDFLQLQNPSPSSSGDSECSDLNEQFASELAQTLSRSNLRRRTESMDNLLDSPLISESNGSVRISVNNNNNNISKQNLDNITKALQNRVTINIPPENRKLDAPNGILKNSNGNHSLHRPLVHQKSITFGEM